MDKPTKAKKQSATAVNNGNSRARVKTGGAKKAAGIKHRDKMAVGDGKEPIAPRQSNNANADENSTKRPVGRPDSYSPDMAAIICAELAEGNKSLRTICRAEDRPCMTTVFKWLAEHPEFTEQYRVAKLAGIEAMMEDTIEIADDGRNDWMETEYGMKVDREAIERSKLRVHTRQWFASRLLPKKYGDKVEQTLKGDADAPITTRVVLVPPKQPAQVTTRPIDTPAKD